MSFTASYWAALIFLIFQPFDENISSPWMKLHSNILNSLEKLYFVQSIDIVRVHIISNKSIATSAEFAELSGVLEGELQT